MAAVKTGIYNNSSIPSDVMPDIPRDTQKTAEMPSLFICVCIFFVCAPHSMCDGSRRPWERQPPTPTLTHIHAAAGWGRSSSDGGEVG